MSVSVQHLANGLHAADFFHLALDVTYRRHGFLQVTSVGNGLEEARLDRNVVTLPIQTQNMDAHFVRTGFSLQASYQTLKFPFVQ
jgi:hypothetical protein